MHQNSAFVVSHCITDNLNGFAGATMRRQLFVYLLKGFAYISKIELIIQTTKILAIKFCWHRGGSGNQVLKLKGTNFIVSYLSLNIHNQILAHTPILYSYILRTRDVSMPLSSLKKAIRSRCVLRRLTSERLSLVAITLS